MMVIGEWTPQGFVTEQTAEYAEACVQIQRLAQAFAVASAAVGDDLYAVFERLNLSTQLQDVTEAAHLLAQIRHVTPDTFTQAQYQSYVWFCDQLKNSLWQGELVWWHRVVLLDTANVQDALIAWLVTGTD